MGSSCSTAVEHTPCDREVMGSYPAGCRGFRLFSFFSVYLSLSFSGGLEKNVCLAVQLEAKLGS